MLVEHFHYAFIPLIRAQFRKAYCHFSPYTSFFKEAEKDSASFLVSSCGIVMYYDVKERLVVTWMKSTQVS